MILAAIILFGWCYHVFCGKNVTVEQFNCPLDAKFFEMMYHCGLSVRGSWSALLFQPTPGFELDFLANNQRGIKVEFLQRLQLENVYVLVIIPMYFFHSWTIWQKIIWNWFKFMQDHTLGGCCITDGGLICWNELDYLLCSNLSLFCGHNFVFWTGRGQQFTVTFNEY